MRLTQLLQFVAHLPLRRLDFLQLLALLRRLRLGSPLGHPFALGLHLPSEILFENSPDKVRRGNILEWEQPLASRLRGEPLDLRVQMAPESILHTTLLLFGSTILAAAAAFAGVLWWVARRGRPAEAESHP